MCIENMSERNPIQVHESLTGCLSVYHNAQNYKSFIIIQENAGQIKFWGTHRYVNLYKDIWKHINAGFEAKFPS